MKRSGSKRRSTPEQRVTDRRVSNSKRTVPHGGATPPANYQPTTGGRNPKPLPWEYH